MIALFIQIRCLIFVVVVIQSVSLYKIYAADDEVSTLVSF